jgi:hypothetical protein
MIGFFAWWAIVWGATMILTQSSLFAPFRLRCLRLNQWLGTLVICPMCSGFWVGVAACALGVVGPSAVLSVPWPVWARAWADGCAASALCWFSHVVLGHLAEHRYDVTRR